MTMADLQSDGDSRRLVGGRFRKRAHTAPPAGLCVSRLETTVGSVLVFSFPHAALSWPEALTRAEQAVGELALEGLTNAEIARARRTSMRTVSNQLAAVFRKTGTRSRLELAAHMLRR